MHIYFMAVASASVFFQFLLSSVFFFFFIFIDLSQWFSTGYLYLVGYVWSREGVYHLEYLFVQLTRKIRRKWHVGKRIGELDTKNIWLSNTTVCWCYNISWNYISELDLFLSPIYLHFLCVFFLCTSYRNPELKNKYLIIHFST